MYMQENGRTMSLPFIPANAQLVEFFIKITNYQFQQYLIKLLLYSVMRHQPKEMVEGETKESFFTIFIADFCNNFYFFPFQVHVWTTISDNYHGQTYGHVLHCKQFICDTILSSEGNHSPATIIPRSQLSISSRFRHCFIFCFGSLEIPIINQRD